MEKILEVMACESGNNGPSKKKAKLYCQFRSSWKDREFEVEVEGVKKRVSGSILSHTVCADKAKCTGCGVTFSLRYGGANDVVKHFSTKNHWKLRLHYLHLPGLEWGIVRRL